MAFQKTEVLSGEEKSLSLRFWGLRVNDSLIELNLFRSLLNCLLSKTFPAKSHFDYASSNPVTLSPSLFWFYVFARQYTTLFYLFVFFNVCLP